MTQEGYKRKLTAILSADVEGYSRLMGEDEDATIRTLTSYRELMSTLIQKHRGRVVDSPGDNLLAEFLSVVDAVRCAVEIQEELRARNAELPENRRMEFRIGINLGDVVQEEERIYGDGINIAARVEGIAEGGGICISGTVYDSIKNKLSLSYESLGEHTVKNIKEPVRVYRMRIGPEAMVKKVPRRWHRAALAAVAVLVVVTGACAIWNFYFRPPPIEPASVDRMAFPLPEKPSIAVLPFDNLSGDPEQDYLADGFSESIITALSYIPQMFVIARNSSFTYKGKPVKVQQVSEELGVRYILEGSVLKSGDKVRITAQLIDALSGGHIWSERFDRDFKDLFDLLDEITQAITVELQVKLTEGEQARMRYGSTRNLEAWGYAVKGYDVFLQLTKEGVAKGRELFEKALEIDPEYAHALTSLAWTHSIDAWFSYTDTPEESLKRAVELAKKSVVMNDKDPSVHSLWQKIYLRQGQHDKALEEGRKAIALGPNDADAHMEFGLALSYSGFFEEAVQMCEKGMRLHPHRPLFYFAIMIEAYYRAGRYEECLAMAEQVIEPSRKAEYWPGVASGYLYSAMAHIKLGQESEARKEVAEALKIWPSYSLEYERSWHLGKPAIVQQELDVLRKGGVPEHAPLPLPDKPSIAVLPFVNMSEDPEQEYFSDGITEEIITALSKTPKLFVIASNSTFTYKGKPTKVQQIGRELGVKYVLEGSVRKAGDKVRITAQLVDAQTGHHLWAERYDRELKDIFALQDEITMNVIEALELKLTEGEQALIYARGTNNLEAYLKSLQAIEYSRRQNPDDNQKAKRILEEAIGLDPNYAMAYRQLGTVYIMEVWLGTTKAPKESLGKAAEFSKKALALDASLGIAHALLGHIFILMRNYEKGIEEGQRAVDLEPNGADSHAFLGMGLQFADRPEEAIKILKKAIRLNPMPPGWYLHNLAIAYRNMDRYDEAIGWAKKAVDRHPSSVLSHLALASCYSLAGREEEAQAEATQALRIDPKFSLERLTKTTPQKNQETKKRFIDSLRKAGLK